MSEREMPMDMVGGIGEVEGNANSAEFEDLARFAVDEYNKKENAMLEYEKVLKVKQQVVAGTMYYITLEAKDGDKLKIYEAKVWEKPWMNFKELQEFNLIGDAPSSATHAEAEADARVTEDLESQKDEPVPPLVG